LHRKAVKEADRGGCCADNGIKFRYANSAEVAYLKEKSLSQEDLRVYKDYRDKYAAEKKRLSGLPKD
jgi:hypothetical protein